MSKKKKKNDTSIKDIKTEEKSNKVKDKEIELEKTKKVIKTKENNINKVSNDKKDKVSEKDIKKESIKTADKINEETVSKEIKNIAPIRDSKKYKHPIINGFSIILLLVSFAYFIISLFFSKEANISTLINSLLLILFTILFVSVSITTVRKNKNGFLVSSLLLFSYFIFGILTTLDIINIPSKTVIDFTNMSLTDVIKWSDNNDVKIIQNYEYSDMILEYFIINQDVKAGTKLKEIDEITIAISEGPSPYKEVILPNMIGWNTDDVLEFIKKNYLSNVSVEFIQGTTNENTLIEQSKSGNVRRNEEIIFTFSYGDERHYSEVKLIDLINKSKFDAEFYLKQWGIKYEFDYDFSDKIERGKVMAQDVKAGETIIISGDDAKTLKVTISKGPKIIVPDLSKFDAAKITEWVIDNKLKIEFKERYDDSIEESGVIEVSCKKDDVLEEGTLITVTLSKGKLVMEKFDSYSAFREWADTYGIGYEEAHEFSDDVAAGNVIRYSYNVGATIKNGDVVIVTISDGRKVAVPNVVGSTKSQAQDKLSKAGLNYSFVYKYSSSVAKGKAISQSMSAGSEVSQGTTVTVTISNGPTPASNTGSNNNSSGNTKPTTPTCTPQTYTIGRNLNNIFANYSGFDTVKSQLYSFFASNYPNVKINVVGVDGGDATSGSYIGGIGPGSSVTSCNSTAYTINIAK